MADTVTEIPKKEAPAEKLSLDEAVKKAAEDSDIPEEESAEVDVEVPETQEGESEGEEDSELSEAELNESKRLYKALKDPKTSGIVLAALAQQAGLLGKNTPETKAEVKEAKAEIKDILIDALGTEYKFLADKLSPALDKIFEQERLTQEEKYQAIQKQNVEREVVEVTKELNTETKGEYKKYESRIAELSEEIPAGSMNIKTYLKRLYAIATSEGRKTSEAAKVGKINRNATDVPSRLRQSAVPAREAAMPDKKMSLDEAINHALESLTKK